MTRALVLFLFLLNFYPSNAGSVDSLLSELELTIKNKETYFKQKTLKINKLKDSLLNLKIENHQAEFDINLKLFNEYESFLYDSAYKYVERMRHSAYRLNNPVLIATSKIKLGFVLLSSGLFKEALDSLISLRIKNLPDSVKREYYAVVARTYFDLADYDNDLHFSQQYKRIGNLYLDTAIGYTRKNSSKYWSYESLRRMKSPGMKGAQEAFEYWMANYKLNDHQFAIAASSLGYIYSLNNQREKAVELLTRAAIADIRSSTKETVALRNLSNLLFQQGDTKTAYRYIKMALDDATFYNARHRKIEIATILPIIEGERLSTVEAQKKKLERYIIAISILSVLIIVSLLIIVKQLNKLRKVRRILQNTNMHLQAMNKNLSEANKIKEEYIGYFFSINSEYIDKIDALQKSIHRKIVARQFDDLDGIVKNSDLKKERENLFINFDKIFIKLFPNFVEEFNKLFRDEDKVVLKKDEILNPDLRIYALMRLGIKDNEKIARFLNYSVTTIYTYKTKLKSKSILKDQFEEKVMEIRTHN